MKIKVYNENGCIRVAKESDNEVEIVLFQNVDVGEVAVIDIDSSSISVVGYLNSITVKENH